jgi:hypothetical protein
MGLISTCHSITRFCAWGGPHREIPLVFSTQILTRAPDTSFAGDLRIAVFTDVHTVGFSRFGNG